MTIRDRLLKLYWRIQGVIVPSLKNSQFLYEDVLKSYANPEFIWLDLGCGHQLLPPWRSAEEKKLIACCNTIVGFDYDAESLKKHQAIGCKVRGTSSALPFKDHAFDLITANMVVEHFNNVDAQFREIARILKPGGLFIFHTPNVFGYTTILARIIPESLKGKLAYLFQGREEEDVFPAYYRVNSASQIRKVAELNGLTIQKIRMAVSSAQFIILPPILIFELLWIKLLMTKPFKNLRTNIIAILQKN